MSGPPGQITTELPGADGRPARTLISAGREVEQGARSMLLLAPGLFRYDVVPHEDTVQTILRNLSPEPAAEVEYGPVAGGVEISGPGAAAPSTGRFGGEVVLLAADGTRRPVAKILVGSVCHLDRGVTSFTAQATLL